MTKPPVPTQPAPANPPPAHPPDAGGPEAYSSSLAFELVAKLDTLPNILKRHHISKEQLKSLLHNPHFRQLLAQVRQEWEHPMNAEARVRAKALMAVEDTMIEVVNIINNPEASAQAKIEAFKNITALGAPRPTAGAPAQTGAAGGVNVVINLDGGDKKVMTFDQFEPVPEELIADDPEGK